MSAYIEKSAKTVEMAIDLALAELQADMDEVDCQIITAGSKGFMGVGSRDAKVRVARLKDLEAENKAAEASAAAEQVQVAEQAKASAEEKTESKLGVSFFSRRDKKAEAAKAKSDVETENISETANEKEAILEPVTTAEPVKSAATTSGSFSEQVIIAVREFLDPVFESLKVNPECRVEEREGVFWLTYSGKGLGCVIGRRGETLDALQYLTNLSVGMKLGKDKKIRIILDVEGYRQNRNETLAALAEKMAAKVKKTGRDVVLEPMSPHERRVIHMTLQDRPGIRTYSQGEEPYRKVVITKHK